MKKLFNGAFNNRTVLLTGHTGFKGSWLTLWLKAMGANVIGYSLEAPTSPSNFELQDRTGDTDLRGDTRASICARRSSSTSRNSSSICGTDNGAAFL
jgi:CDP-glucose 4,6-dehydratase